MRIACIAGAALALSLAACGHADSTLEIWLSALPPDDPGSVEFVVDHPDGSSTLVDDDFSPGPQSTVLRAGPVRVPDSGQISVNGTYRDGDGRVFRAEGSWDLREDFEWSLGLWRAPVDPNETCMGCRAVWPFVQVAGPSNAGDTYWLVMGGNERGSDVVY